MFMVMAGGGIRGGQVIGATDDKGTGADARRASLRTTWPPRSTARWESTTTKEYHTNTGRPGDDRPRTATPIDTLLA